MPSTVCQQTISFYHIFQLYLNRKKYHKYKQNENYNNIKVNKSAF